MMRNVLRSRVLCLAPRAPLQCRWAGGGGGASDPRPSSWSDWQEGLKGNTNEKATLEVMRQVSFAVDSDPKCAMNVGNALGMKLDDSTQLTALVQALRDADPAPPPQKALRQVFIANACFFWIFGFVDNGLMVCVGDYIDTTLGVAFGLTSMAAAGLGNAFSNGCGIGLGAGFEIFGLMPKVELTPAQAASSAANTYRRFGTFFGMVAGCLCGLAPLYFLDGHESERLKREKALEDALFDIVCERTRQKIDSERISLWLVDAEKDEVFTRSATNSSEIRLPRNRSSIVTTVINSRESLLIPDAQNDWRFDKSNDKATGFTTRSVLCVAIQALDGSVIGALQFINKTTGTFTVDDLNLVTQLANSLGEICAGSRLSVRDFVIQNLQMRGL